MRGTDEQFLRLLRVEQGKLMRIARALTGQEADAWDLVQEATLTAYDRFVELRGGPEAFGPWIRRILSNKAKNLLRQRSRTLVLDVVNTYDEVDPAPGPEEQLESIQLWHLVMELDEHHRQVLALRFLVDLQVEEIADLLNVPAGTVKSRIHRALGALRKRLHAEEKGAAEGQ